MVIPRKYRPQQFKEITGQEHVTTTLINAIETGRIAHAYLFAGPKGIGKTTIARIFAKALNCKKGPAPIPCGKCVSCREITSGISMDVLEIDGASNRGIDEIRQLRENVKFAPSNGRFKIYIIDEVHMLTDPAFNALLKTLEEPPSHVKFFFATTAPNKIPATILSRCQRFDLRRLSNKLIAERLQYIAEHEKINISQETLYTVGRYADGSMRDAESTLDKLIAYKGADIKHNDALTILGVVKQEVLHNLSEAIAASDTEQALIISDQVFEQGKDIQQFILDIISRFRNILLSKYSPNLRKVIEFPENEITKITELGKKFNQAQILEIIDIFTELYGKLRWSLSKRITMEVGIVKAAMAKKKIGLAQLISRLEQLEEKTSQYKENSQDRGLTKTTQPSPILPHSEHRDTDSLNSEDILKHIKESWDGIVADIGKRNPLLKSYLAEGIPLSIKNNILTVGFESSHSLHQESLEKAKNKEFVTKRFQEKLGIPIKIRFEIRKTIQAKPSKEKKEEKIINNPLVEKVRQKFNAKIISIKTPKDSGRLT